MQLPSTDSYATIASSTVAPTRHKSVKSSTSDWDKKQSSMTDVLANSSKLAHEKPEPLVLMTETTTAEKGIDFSEAGDDRSQQWQVAQSKKEEEGSDQGLEETWRSLCDVSPPREAGGGGVRRGGGGTYCPPPQSWQRKCRPTAEESQDEALEEAAVGTVGERGGRPVPHPKPNKGWGPSGAFNWGLGTNHAARPTGAGRVPGGGE